MNTEITDVLVSDDFIKHMAEALTEEEDVVLSAVKLFIRKQNKKQEKAPKKKATKKEESDESEEKKVGKRKAVKKETPSDEEPEEKKPKKKVVKKETPSDEEEEKKPAKKEVTKKGLSLSKYSDKSFALFGEKTKDIKDEIMAMNGKWCKGLKVGGVVIGGWIFSLKYTRNVIEFLQTNELEFAIKGFGKVDAKLRENDGYYWSPETLFVIKREDDSEGVIVGTAESEEDRVHKLKSIDRAFASLLGLECIEKAQKEPKNLEETFEAIVDEVAEKNEGKEEEDDATDEVVDMQLEDAWEDFQEKYGEKGIHPIEPFPTKESFVSMYQIVKEKFVKENEGEEFLFESNEREIVLGMWCDEKGITD